MAIADPALVIKFTQQSEVDSQEAYKHKSKLVHLWKFCILVSTLNDDHDLDAPLLRFMLSLATAQETTWWSSVYITIPSSMQTSTKKTPFWTHHRPFWSTLRSPTQSGMSRRPPVDVEKHRFFGKEKGINSFETLSSSIRIRKLTWSQIVYILVYGLLYKAHCSTP